MRKLLTLWPLLLSFVVWSQPQRLVMLPSILNTAEGVSQVSTLCIDYFRPVPTTTDRLNALGGNHSISGHLQGNNSASKATMVDLPTERDRSLFFGSPDADGNVPEHYKQFIEEKVDYYKQSNVGKSFTQQQQNKLQNDIWEYNILDVLGFMGTQNTPSVEFSRAKTKFKEAYQNKYSSALDFGASVSDMAAFISLAQTSLPYADKIYHVYRIPGGRFVAFDNKGHIVSASNSSAQIARYIINSSDDYENVHLIMRDFVNKESFLTNLNIEGIRSSKKVSFSEYNAIDLHLSGDRYSIPHLYTEANVNTRTLGNQTYLHCTFTFREIKEIQKLTYVDAYALSKPVLIDMISAVNKIFSVGLLFDRTKQKMSLNSFLHNFKSRVKRIHNITSEKDFIILVRSETSTIGTVMNKVRPKARDQLTLY